MLTSRHRELLRERYGVHTWHVEQYDHEAVFIPGGCAHQVRPPGAQQPGTLFLHESSVVLLGCV